MSMHNTWRIGYRETINKEMQTLHLVILCWLYFILFFGQDKPILSFSKVSIQPPNLKYIKQRMIYKAVKITRIKLRFQKNKFHTHAYMELEPSTALTQSSCKDGSSSFLGATALMYSISNIFSCKRYRKQLEER